MSFDELVSWRDGNGGYRTTEGSCSANRADTRTANEGDAVSNAAAATHPTGGAAGLLTIYDRALPQVYGYIVRRCGTVVVAEDLTSEVFMAAAAALRNGSVDEIGVGWLIGTARHKLIDHWRRTERQRKAFTLLGTDEIEPDPNDEPITTTHAHDVLERLSTEHRAALTLRYIDGLGVDDVATILDRSVHATESLLQRAKTAFRHVSAEQHRQRRDVERGDLR